MEVWVLVKGYFDTAPVPPPYVTTKLNHRADIFGRPGTHELKLKLAAGAKKDIRQKADQQI